MTKTWVEEAEEIFSYKPGHILFLCVANSARSQIAEGIARSIAPTWVRFSSAGSNPSSVRPEAVAVLHEIGIDISRQVSMGFDEVERPVDAVITLCAEEVCPVWLEDVPHIHWALTDPVIGIAGEKKTLDAFRKARDELVRRINMVLHGQPSRIGSDG